MSILAKLNLADGDWTFDVQPESPSPDIEVGFRDGDGPAVFDGLAFGLTVSVGGEDVYTAVYPPEGVTYRQTDQAYISNDRVTLASDDVATLSVWAENAGVRYDSDITFTVPRPAQPFPSWEWVDGSWQPPTPYPNEGEWVWDEKTTSWVPWDGEQ